MRKVSFVVVAVVVQTLAFFSKTKTQVRKTNLRALSGTGALPGWPAPEHRRWSLFVVVVSGGGVGEFFSFFLPLL